MVELVPPIKALSVAADGKLHDLPQGTVPAPFPVAAGVGGELQDAAPAMMTLFNSMRQLFGRESGGLDVTDQGLAFWGTLEMK